MPGTSHCLARSLVSHARVTTSAVSPALSLCLSLSASGNGALTTRASPRNASVGQNVTVRNQEIVNYFGSAVRPRSVEAHAESVLLGVPFAVCVPTFLERNASSRGNAREYFGLQLQFRTIISSIYASSVSLPRSTGPPGIIRTVFAISSFLSLHNKINII